MSPQTTIVMTSAVALIVCALVLAVRSPRLSDQARLGWVAALIIFNVFGAVAFLLWYSWHAGWIADGSSWCGNLWRRLLASSARDVT
jgi:hypothetical protein